MRKLLRTPSSWLILAAFAMVLLSAQGGVGTTQAAEQARIELLVPGQTKVGDEIEIAATLSAADGRPIDGVLVIFYLPVVFANVPDEIEIGRSVTDEQGLSTVRYAPRQWGEQRIIAQYMGGGEYSMARTSATILVAPGPQLYQEEAGVDVPGVGVWALSLALMAVWGVLLSIVGLLFLVAMKGEHILPYRYQRRGFK